MDEFRRTQKEDLPSLRFNAPTKIDVFVPRWEKSFVEAASLIVGITANHDGCSCGLVDGYGLCCFGRECTTAELALIGRGCSLETKPQILANERADGRERSRQVLIAGISPDCA